MQTSEHASKKINIDATNHAQARTVKYVLQWYKRRVQIPPHSAVSLRQGREFPTLDDRLINILRSPDRVLVLEAYLDVHFAPQIPDTESDASDAADEDSQQSGTKPQGIETSDVELVEVDDDPTLTVANQATQQDQTQPFIVVDDSGSTSDSNSWDEQAADDGAGSEDASSQDDSDNDLNEASGESEIDELEELKDPPGSIWA